MKITVDVPESQVENLVKQRIAELFSDDSRYRETGVRELVRKIVDDAAVSAVQEAQKSMSAKFPALAEAAVTCATQEAIASAAKRGLKALSKLYDGFDPAKLTTEQRAWLERQIAEAAQKTDKEGKR